MTMHEQIAAYKEDLELFETPNDKLEYIFDLAKDVKPLNVKYKTDTYLVQGCSSRAWLHKTYKNGKIILEAEGESLIAKGMLALLLSIFSERTPDEILSFNPDELNSLGLNEMLSPVRQQSLESLLTVIYQFAKSTQPQQEQNR